MLLALVDQAVHLLAHVGDRTAAGGSRHGDGDRSRLAWGPLH